MADFIKECETAWWEQLLCVILRLRPIPRHIAFIMDGNRRYAKKKGESILEGHSFGFEALAKTLFWCRSIGIAEVTIYAFSIENFKRSEDEVQELMDLARKKFAQLLDHRETMMENGVCFRFFGNLTLLPEDIRMTIQEVSRVSRDNQKLFVNICVSYTSSDEIQRALKLVLRGVKDGLLKQTDICETLISKSLDSGQSTDPDLLIRTSGETRLSDFQLWQCSFTCIYFDNVLWPDYKFWNLFNAIMYYQQQYHYFQKLKVYQQGILPPAVERPDEKRISLFLTAVKES